jgi:hypothetical protein
MSHCRGVFELLFCVEKEGVEKSESGDVMCIIDTNQPSTQHRP